MAGTARKGLAKRAFICAFFAVVLVLAFMPVRAYADDAVLPYPNNPTPGGGGGQTLTWNIQYAPDMSPASNPSRSMVSGSWDAIVQTHYPYFGSNDMRDWYVQHAAGGLEGAGMECLAYWVISIYDLGVPISQSDEHVQGLIGYSKDRTIRGDYGWWSSRQILYAGPPINTGSYYSGDSETEPTIPYTMVPPLVNGGYKRPNVDGSITGWNYGRNAAWPDGLDFVRAYSTVNGTGKSAVYELHVNLSDYIAANSEAARHVYWVTLVGVSGREKVLTASGEALPGWGDSFATKVKFGVRVKPTGMSGGGWLVAQSYAMPNGQEYKVAGRWANTGKELTIRSSWVYTPNLRVTEIEIKFINATTAEGSNVTKAIFTGATGGGTPIWAGGRVVGYRWSGYNLNTRNPYIRFYYRETENTNIQIRYEGVGIPPASPGPYIGTASYNLVVSGARLVDY